MSREGVAKLIEHASRLAGDRGRLTSRMGDLLDLVRESAFWAGKGGLTGRQGVLIPESNARHLMLREDVVEAVGHGRFHVHAVGTVDEGMALLTGREAGARGEDGRFPPGSVNAAVEAALEAKIARRKELGSSRP